MTPKTARQYRRKPPTSDRTRNGKLYRVTGSWDARPDRPAVRTTPDRAKARRIADQFAADGAYVIVEQARGFEWRTLFEIDGPAQAAEHEAMQQLAAAGHPPTPDTYRPDADDRHRTWLAWMDARAEADRRAAEETARAQAEADARRRRLAAEATRTARTLMQPPAIVRPEHRQRARHITGAQR